MPRDSFIEAVKLLAAKRVAFTCSNPNCRAITTGPQSDPTKSVNIGVAAHIIAASPRGPRSDQTVSAEDRTHITNAIWLCQNCAKLIDSDVNKYTTSLLRKWKKNAEDLTERTIGIAAVSLNQSYSSLSIEETDILIAASENGEIHYFNFNEIPAYISIGNNKFEDSEDRAFAALYIDALESLLRRGLIKREGENLFELTGSGFKLAKTLAESQSHTRTDENSSQDKIEIDVTIDLDPGEHWKHKFSLANNYGISYEFDSDDKFDVLILEREDYSHWRNDEELVYEPILIESKTYVSNEFWPSAPGSYVIVVESHNEAPIEVDIEICLLVEG